MHRFQVVIIVEQVGRLLAGLLSHLAVWEVGSVTLMSMLEAIRPLLVMMLAARFSVDG